ncbi:unnamed protein product [Anisakis simplex]|uniref:isopentenyl-diphosphate Delta-isomerase n=1 Tax=Anisakis simplex TaxID=6269 RepID=A0A0M3K677_ANISI|nr:unnamed protein product [Anisakis simplex]
MIVLICSHVTKQSLCALSSVSSAHNQATQNHDVHDNQLKYMEENCIVVDTNDKPIRPITKRDGHFRDPVLHRAFSVFLFTKCSRMILQKRSVHKITFPSLWTNSCCSHPLWTVNEMAPDGDSSLGVCNAAKRKLKHELGIEDIDIASMNLVVGVVDNASKASNWLGSVMRRFIYKAMSDSEWGEYELDYVIVVPDFDMDKVNINTEEVEQIAVVDREKLKQMLASLRFGQMCMLKWCLGHQSTATNPEMHTIWSRANAIFAFMISALSAMAFCVFLTSFLQAGPVVPVQLSASNVRVKSVSDYSANGARSDVAMAYLSIDADLTPIFNWNVKQLFLYLVAEYSSPSNPVNQVVLWDKIVMRGDLSSLHEENSWPKYYFMDDGSNLLNHPNVTLVLRWNVLPNIGYLGLAQGNGQHIMKFPSTYYTGRF